MTYDCIYEQETLAKMSENGVRTAQHYDYRYKQYIVKYNYIPYFSIGNAHLMYNAHPKLF